MATEYGKIMSAIIELKNLTLRYPEQEIFADFSASVACGEFIGIFGPNGAGKSTLLRAILGLIQPGIGEILVFGKKAQCGCSAIGYVPQFQQHLSTNNLTGRVYISATINGFNWGLPLLNKQRREQVDRVIDLVKAQKYIDRPFVQLSGGEKKRIVLAQALLNHPKILLLDEPLSGLDPGQQGKMIDLIQNLRKELNMTVLFTAHDLNPLLNVMTNIFYLAAGRALVGAVSEVVTSSKLSGLYGSPIEVIKSDDHVFVIHKQFGSNIHDTNHHSGNYEF